MILIIYCRLFSCQNVNDNKFAPVFFLLIIIFLFFFLPCFIISHSCSVSHRCYCKDCLNILVGPDAFDKLKDVDPWSCFICQPSQCKGNLKLRADWSVKVQDFFANNSAMAFVRAVRMSKLPDFPRHTIMFFFT